MPVDVFAASARSFFPRAPFFDASTKAPKKAKASMKKRAARAA